MFLAEEVAAKTGGATGFDVFMVLFTLLIGYALYRAVKAPQKNMIAIGFGTVCLLIFLFMDVLMVMNWFGVLK
jgi:hypothetical protein